MKNKKYENKAGRIKDYIKGFILIGVGVLLIILGVVWVSILPLAIVLWVLGCPAAATGVGLIIHNKKNNTIYAGGSSSESSSGSSSSDSPKRFRHPEKPAESNVSQSAVLRAVRHLGEGQVRVSNAYVVETYPNEFNIELTLSNYTGESDMLETYANAVVDQARRAVENLGASATISAHF